MSKVERAAMRTNEIAEKAPPQDEGILVKLETAAAFATGARKKGTLLIMDTKTGEAYVRLGYAERVTTPVPPGVPVVNLIELDRVRAEAEAAAREADRIRQAQAVEKALQERVARYGH